MSRLPQMTMDQADAIDASMSRLKGFTDLFACLGDQEEDLTSEGMGQVGSLLRHLVDDLESRIKEVATTTAPAEKTG